MLQHQALNGETLTKPVIINSDILSDLMNNLEDEVDEEGMKLEVKTFSTGCSREGHWVPLRRIMGIAGVNLKNNLVDVYVSKNKIQQMKLGKFLKKAGFSDKIARDYSAKLRASVEMVKGAELSFTKNGEEAIEVYKNGPDSCMSSEDSVSVYDSEDVAVAYVKLGERVVARSVVCINKDIGLKYVCIYGYRDIMFPLLKKAGFESGTLAGCKLKLEFDSYGNIVCPYLDCGSMATVVGDKWLQLDEEGYYDTQNTSGVLTESTCDMCGEREREDDLRYCEDASSEMCDDCFDSCHVYFGNDVYHIESSYVTLLHEGGYALTEKTIHLDYLDQCHLLKDVIYSNTDDDSFLVKDIVEAIVGPLNKKDNCYLANCTYVKDIWVHESFLDSYLQQLELDLD